jgi:chromosome partitioning protein
MEHVSISRQRLRDLLNLTEDELAACETNGPLKSYAYGVREEYSLEDLSLYRMALQRRPPKKSVRKQLFLNFKGGTGKTSLSVAYAHRLAELGHSVLLVDLDSQGHATKCLGYEGENCETTLYEVLIKKAAMTDARIETALSELHLVPANLRMATIDLALMPLANREGRLRKALATVEKEYEYIVLDAPPSFGLLNLNAIYSADDLFVPVLPDFLSFHGLKLLFETLDDIEEDLEHRLDRLFVVVNQFNPTTKIARAAFDALQEHYAEYLLPLAIRQCTKFAQASSEGLPIFAFDPESKGAQDIQALIDKTDLPGQMPAEELHA